MTARKSTTAAPRQTQRGVAKAAATRKQTDTSAAKVRNINTAKKAAEKTVDDAVKSAVSEAAPKPIRTATKSTKDLSAIETLAAQLASAEGAVLAATDAEAKAKLTDERNALILKLIKLDAGYSFIAKTRNVAPSTNRGLCRVLEGGKRL